MIDGKRYRKLNKESNAHYYPTRFSRPTGEKYEFRLKTIQDSTAIQTKKKRPFLSLDSQHRRILFYLRIYGLFSSL